MNVSDTRELRVHLRPRNPHHYIDAQPLQTLKQLPLLQLLLKSEELHNQVLLVLRYMKQFPMEVHLLTYLFHLAVEGHHTVSDVKTLAHNVLFEQRQPSLVP